METSSIKQNLFNPDSLESLLKKTLLSKSLTREELEQTITNLGYQGWNRKRIYDVCRYINFDEELLEQEHDILGDFCNELMGNCSTANMIKLPGEPEDREEFLDYVYSDWWKS
ncbi:hypothetical protein GO730_05850 [Spirosoma sp. HMF3257]|uniref:Uncharacterized protein n=1 Tax=Spirosoma telluris TaxID=2183553 RepID=A0A327NI66_9BACT|nr:hypothetical protein [Spirosoma telluris]RAI73999.1 hypothetical protein HMF3257_05805 [Spirosoma telluris]